MSQPNTAPTSGTNPAGAEPTITPTPTTAPTTQPEPTPTPAPAAAPAPAPQPAPTPAPVLAELDDEDRAEGVTADGDRVAVPQSSFRKLKDKAAERGRAQALAELAARATALGYSSVDEMFAALERSKETAPVTTPANPNPNPTTTPPTAAPAAAPAAATPPPTAPPAATTPPPAAAPVVDPADPAAPENDRRYSPEQRRRLKQAREEMQQKTAQERAAREAAERAVAAKDAELATWRAEQSMREDLIRAGCVELDFTFSKLREHLKSIEKDEEKLKTFDLAAWAEEQRKAKPFLFGAQVVPATTGNAPGAGGAPPAPNPGDAAARAAGGATKNAKDMTPAEWDAYKRQHGLG